MFAGQLEVQSTLASNKHSNLHSKQSTLHSNVKDISTQTSNNNKEDTITHESENVNMNVIILQSNSSNKFLKEVIEKKILKNNNGKSEEQQNLNQKRSMIKNLFLQQKAQQSLDDDSPVLLRKFLSDHPVGIKSKCHHKSNLNSRNRKTSEPEVFCSLESNLDQSCPSKPLHPTAIVDAQASHLSSLPSMTSGRFYSANSSVFSGVSSPRSDLSPSKESDGRIEDVCDKPNKHYIEPIVEIVDHVDGLDEEIEIRARDKSPINNNSKSFEDATKETVTHLDFNSNSSFLKKSFSLTTAYESVTKVCVSNEELPLDPSSSSGCTRKNSVKFNCVCNESGDLTNGQRKYQTLPPKMGRMSSLLSKHQKLGLKQLGSRSQQLPNCPKIVQTLYEEGELSGWSTRDIYDVVSQDLPRMDIVILVVNQEEKKLIDETLSKSTGVVGYIKEYWSGFFPLLLIEITEKNEEIEMMNSKSVIAVNSMFSVTHRHG